MGVPRNRVSEIDIPHLICFHPDLVGEYPKQQSIVIDILFPPALGIMIDESSKIPKSQIPPPLLDIPGTWDSPKLTNTCRY